MHRLLLFLVSLAPAAAAFASCPQRPAYTRLASVVVSPGRVRVDLQFEKKLTVDGLEAAACREIERSLAEAEVAIVELRIWGPGAVAGSNPTATALWAPQADAAPEGAAGGAEGAPHLLTMQMPGRPPTLAMLAVTPPPRPTPPPTPVPTPPPAVPIATPPPAPTPVAAPVDDATRRKADILATVERWREAWEARDLDRYMSFYASDFRSDGKDWKGWRARKASVFKGLTQLHVEARDSRVQVVGKRAVVSFTQVYTTEKITESGEKTLYIELRDGVYKIVRETFSRPGEKRHE